MEHNKLEISSIKYHCSSNVFKRRNVMDGVLNLHHFYGVLLHIHKPCVTLPLSKFKVHGTSEIYLGGCIDSKDNNFKSLTSSYTHQTRNRSCLPLRMEFLHEQCKCTWSAQYSTSPSCRRSSYPCKNTLQHMSPYTRLPPKNAQD